MRTMEKEGAALIKTSIQELSTLIVKKENFSKTRKIVAKRITYAR